ncbi:MAG: hypothetical protein H0T13_00965 [Actinobacteria bacterium]|nr:hypothetical protein [Actinomycetota bacterium]
MADTTPQFLTLETNRDSERIGELILRRAVVAFLVVAAALALTGFFGQPPRETVGRGAGATLEVLAPERVRGGLFFQGRFTIIADRDIEHATLVLDRGWLEGMHINTIEPAPVGETSRQGRLALDFGHLGPDDTFVAYLQFQVNPTNVGSRSHGVGLYDGETLLASVDRDVVVFP